MTRDEIVYVLLVLSFASFATAHVALCLALTSREPRFRSVVAFFAFPLAPIWGAKDGQHKRVVLWVLFGLAYAVLRFVASR